MFSYDRRGRGDSGDTPPYAVEREVEDLAAIVAEAGGRAAAYGHSSGAALVLHAAARGVPLTRMVLHEPPFGSGSEQERRAAREEAAHLSELLDQGRPADAVAFYLASAGMPPDVVAAVSADPALVANAATLVSDPYEVMGAASRGGLTPTEQAAEVSPPALVLAGDASPERMVAASRQIAEALPRGRLQVLDGQEHVVAPEVLAPVLIDFLAE